MRMNKMTEVSQIEEDSVDTQQEPKEQTNSENNNSEVEKEIERLKQELLKKEEILEKARRSEKHRGNERDALRQQLQEVIKYKDLYEKEYARRTDLEHKIEQNVINTTIATVLTEAKAKSVDIVAKLIDRSDLVVKDGAVDAALIKQRVEELKTTSAFLFDEVKVPSVKQAADGTPKSGYETEMRAARTQKEIQEVMRKYNKIS